MKRQIFAIGGGGFGRSMDNLELERYFQQQTGKQKPSVCFIPTASGEDPKYIASFYQAFTTLNCIPSYLSLFQLPTQDLESFILEKDAIYVGGGNTKSMLGLWKEWKLDVYLRKAWEKGVVLGGVSAGSNCWFEECTTDSIPGDLTVLPCLGFLKGSTCPHYDGEEKRRPSYHKLMLEKSISPGIAIDDGVGVHYVDDQIVNIIHISKGAAYLVSVGSNGITEFIKN